MTKNAKCIEVRSADGHLMFALRVYDEAQSQGSNAKPPAKRNGRQATSQRSQGPEGNGDKDGDAITAAQKRYLFRILADQGTEGEQALSYLKERFGVDMLTNVSKREASTLIEELLGNGAAT